jgi:uncharacterized membrane protein (UPF0127 family)
MRVTVVVVALTFAAIACTPPDAKAAPPSPSATAPSPVPAMPAPKGEVTIDTASGPQRFTVELAITDGERQHGLMFREHLDDDAGMLFLFERQQPLSFWMKNTHIPLDMIFIDESGVVAGIVENADPMTTTSRKVDKPSRYVLEVNGGTSRKLGLTAGERVHFAGVPANLVDARVLK